ncbi:MAG: response regulator transcription factor [Flavobacteriales bacterium]|nr:response regulator transcription factor [Flavobacteriales bacterium]
MTNEVKNIITILIVDDHKDVCLATSAMLSSVSNFRIIGLLNSGINLIEFLKYQRPDIILMDISMEPVNGIEATKFVLSKYETINIIGFSMHNNKGYMKKMINAGAKHYLLKSTPLSEIIDCINTVCNIEKQALLD